MLEHATLKLVHQSSVLLSITGFAARGALMLLRSPLLTRRWMRTWPHVIDTVLLGSGVWMAVNLRLHPGDNPWLAAKIVALAAYIGLGFIALRLGRTYARRSVALVAALLCFAYMLLVATSRSVVPF